MSALPKDLREPGAIVINRDQTYRLDRIEHHRCVGVSLASRPGSQNTSMPSASRAMRPGSPPLVSDFGAMRQQHPLAQSVGANFSGFRICASASDSGQFVVGAPLLQRAPLARFVGAQPVPDLAASPQLMTQATPGGTLPPGYPRTRLDSNADLSAGNRGAGMRGHGATRLPWVWNGSRPGAAWQIYNLSRRRLTH